MVRALRNEFVHFDSRCDPVASLVVRRGQPAMHVWLKADKVDEQWLAVTAHRSVGKRKHSSGTDSL